MESCEGPFQFKHVQLGLITQKPVRATSCFQTECQSWALSVSLLLPVVSSPPPPAIFSVCSVHHSVHFNLDASSIFPCCLFLVCFYAIFDSPHCVKSSFFLIIPHFVSTYYLV